MATLILQDPILFKYNTYPVTLMLSPEYIATHFVSNVNVNNYIYNQLLNMHSCCATKGGYSLVTCPTCCKPSKKDKAAKKAAAAAAAAAEAAAIIAAAPIITTQQQELSASFSCDIKALNSSQELPVVNIVKAETSPQVLGDGSFVYTVNVKPVCTSSRNHLHANVFLVLWIFGEVYATRSFALRARKFQSQAKKLRELQVEESIYSRKRGRPSNKKDDLAPAEKSYLVDTNTGYVQQPVFASDELSSGDEAKSTECPNSPSGSENEYNAELPAVLDLYATPACRVPLDNHFDGLSLPDWSLQEQQNIADNDYIWLQGSTDSLFEGSSWGIEVGHPELFEPSHWP